MIGNLSRALYVISNAYTKVFKKKYSVSIRNMFFIRRKTGNFIYLLNITVFEGVHRNLYELLLLTECMPCNDWFLNDKRSLSLLKVTFIVVGCKRTEA